MSKNKVLLALFGLWWNVSCPAQTLSFEAVRQAILSQHPGLQRFRHQAKGYEAMAEGSMAWEAPQIGAGFFMTPYQTRYWKDRNEVVNGMPTMMPGMGNVMVQARQMIPHPARLKAAQRYQRALASVEEEQGKAEASELLYQAKVLYRELQILDRKLQVLSDAQQTARELLQLAEQKVAYNQETLPNVYRTRAQLTLLQKDSAMMAGQRKQKCAQLNGLMRMPPNKVIAVDSSLEIKHYERETLDSAILLQQRSDLLAMKKTIQAMQLKQRWEVAKTRPDFGIEYGHMFAFGSTPNQFSLMGMLSVPLVPWSSKMYRAASQASAYEAAAMQSQQDAMLLESLGMLHGLQQELASAKEQLALYKKMVLPSLQKTFDLALLAYANNTGMLFMVLDARMGVQMATMQYWDAMSNLLTLQAAYEKQMQL